MRFHVLTVFPEMIEQAAGFGVVGQARKEGRLTVSALSPRVFTSNVHQTIDDRPFGGGDGMIMMAEPLDQALSQIKSSLPQGSRSRVIHLSPRGTPLSDAKARELLNFDDLILVASRYGGVDQRFLNVRVDEEISIGDYVLSGGELGALVVIDAVARLLPGVLGNSASSEDESFGSAGELSGGLEYPQYTRPREWQGQAIPEALLSGHHAQIGQWKTAISFLVTLDRRPDLLPPLTAKEVKRIGSLLQALTPEEKMGLGLSPQIVERWRSIVLDEKDSAK